MRWTASAAHPIAVSSHGTVSNTTCAHCVHTDFSGCRDQHLFGHLLALVKIILPAIATAAILCAIAIVIALNQGDPASAGFAVVAAVILHDGCGLVFVYWAPRLIGYDRTICGTLAFETGMQNSGLSIAFALNCFSVLAALPGALFSIWHNLTGAALARRWSSSESRRQSAENSVR